MANANKRTDAHRPGAIVPAHYRYVLSYNMASCSGGMPVPAWGINCEIDRRVLDANRAVIKQGEHSPDGRCCVVALKKTVRFAATGGTGNCSVCGAAFVYGDVWVHESTGEHIHLGHTCAEKYELLADRSEYELSRDRAWAAAAKEIAKEKNKEARAAFLASHPGLEGALNTDHPVIKDIAQRFAQNRTLSDKQVALVFKIATEANKPASEKEQTIAAPVTDVRLTFTGVVVSAKSVESFSYGTQYKMTVKVTTPAGVWLAWGTVPSAMLDSVPCDNGQGRLQNLHGATVEVTARLKPGRDAHFALLERPKGKVVKLSTGGQ